MKVCQKHWDRLIELIKERGAWHLVGDHETAKKQLQAELEGEPGDPKDVDPLLRVNNMIWAHALKAGGLYLMSGDYCPICEAMVHMANVPVTPGGPPAGTEWVENHWTVGAVDAVIQMLREAGALPSIQ